MEASDERWVYLFSSNATLEYLRDVVETLAVPRGFVQHYRYRMKLLDRELRELLPLRGNSLPVALLDRHVVASYLYQEQQATGWRWETTYPIRCGKLVQAYKTGEHDADVAHFYFEVSDYYHYKDGESKGPGILKDELARAIGTGAWGRAYAVLGRPFEIKESSSAGDESAFRSFVYALDPKHIGLTKDGKFTQYYPVFYRIRRLASSKRRCSVGWTPWWLHCVESLETVRPVYDHEVGEAYYSLNETARYVFDFSYQLTSAAMPVDESALTLTCDERFFSTPQQHRLGVASRYDEKAWLLMPRVVEHALWSTLTLKTEVLAPKNMEAVNTTVVVPVRIQLQRWQRAMDFGLGWLSELSLAAATFGTAVVVALMKISPAPSGAPSQQPDSWVWLSLVGGYVLHFGSKFILGLRRLR